MNLDFSEDKPQQFYAFHREVALREFELDPSTDGRSEEQLAMPKVAFHDGSVVISVVSFRADRTVVYEDRTEGFAIRALQVPECRIHEALKDSWTLFHPEKQYSGSQYTSLG